MSKADTNVTVRGLEPGVAPEGMIPLCAPELRGKEWEYVKDCMDTGWVSSVGEYVGRFEKQMASRVGCSHAVAAVNGTAGLHMALLVAGVQPEDEVLVSTLSFIAPANTIRYAGAWPVFIDAESRYWQMDPELVRRFVEQDCQWKNGRLRNRKSGRRVRAIMPVHILGHPVDIDPLLEIAGKYNLAVIEDATESLGARYKERPVGHLGDIACLSFNGNKIITSGGGGMIVTDRVDWAHRARYLTTQAKDDPLEYVHNEIGYNHRLSNVLAAIGCAQLEQLEDYINIKREHANAYVGGLAGIPGISMMPQAPWAFSTYWLSTILVREDEYGISSRLLMRRLAEESIQSRPLWQPLHRALPYRNSQVLNGGVADKLNSEALSLPSSVGLSPEDRGRIVDLIRSMVKHS